MKKYRFDAPFFFLQGQACFSIVKVLLLINTCIMPPTFAPNVVLHYLLISLFCFVLILYKSTVYLIMHFLFSSSLFLSHSLLLLLLYIHILLSFDIKVHYCFLLHRFLSPAYLLDLNI